MDIILIAGHSGVIDQSKIELADSKYILSYGKLGECNLTSEYVNLEREFFKNKLPRNIDEFEEIIPTLQTSDKKFKLHKTKYHDMSITLCTYGFMNERHEQCDTEEEASYVEIYLSGTFIMGNNHPNYNNIFRINPTFDINGRKRFMVPRYVAYNIYKTSVFPNEQMLYNMFLKEQKNGKIIKRESIPLNELIENTKTTLSTIISEFNSDNPTIFILDGCRQYIGDNFHDRYASSASENSGSIESEQSLDDYIADRPNISNRSNRPNISNRTNRKKTLVKPKYVSRITGKSDSLLNLNPKEKKGSRITCKRDSLLNGGKKTRKIKRKYNRK